MRACFHFTYNDAAGQTTFVLRLPDVGSAEEYLIVTTSQRSYGKAPIDDQRIVRIQTKGPEALGPTDFPLTDSPLDDLPASTLAHIRTLPPPERCVTIP